MTLLEDYEGVTEERTKRTVQALVEAATDMLLALLPTDPQYKRKAKFAGWCMNSTKTQVKGLVRAMISRHIDLENDELLVSTLSANFDKLAAMYDPTLEA